MRIQYLTLGLLRCPRRSPGSKQLKGSYAGKYFRGRIFSREDIFARGYFREKIFSREDIFAGRYFRVNSIYIFAKISSRENISNSLFAQFSSRENKVLYSRPYSFLVACAHVGISFGIVHCMHLVHKLTTSYTTQSIATFFTRWS